VLSATASTRLPRVLLAAGLAIGMLVAGASLVQQRQGTALPPGVVARVGPRLILRDEWLKAVAAVSSERRTPLTASDQQQILDRLIDEELLVQHGLALGLVEKDQRLRGALVSEVMLLAYGGRDANAEPEDAALRLFYARNRELFAGTPRLEVAAWLIDPAGQQQPFQPPLPQALLTPAKLRNYLGPSLTNAALTLPLGSRQIFPNPLGDVALEVRRREVEAAPPFEVLRPGVLAEFRRQQDEAAVRKLLRGLRRQSQVVVAEPASP